MYIIRIGNDDYLSEFSIYSFYSTRNISQAKRYDTLSGARKALNILAKRCGRDLNIEEY